MTTPSRKSQWALGLLLGLWAACAVMLYVQARAVRGTQEDLVAAQERLTAAHESMAENQAQIARTLEELERTTEERDAALQALAARHDKDQAALGTAINERLEVLDREHTEEIERRFAGLAAKITALNQSQARLATTVQQVNAIRDSLKDHADAVDRILAEDDALRRVLEHYRRGVGLIYGAYSFHIRVDGELRLAAFRGKPLKLEYSGTGFKASDEGHVITNRHVVEPWTGNDEVRPLLERGLVPRLDRLTITFPGKALIEVDRKTIRVSPDEVDLGIFQAPVEGVPTLPLDEDASLSVRGRRVTVLGYPTGISAMLARAERDEVKTILADVGDAFSVIKSLAAQGMVSPVITQGTVNDVRPRRLIYDALTTSGGSGGPVFGPRGAVVGVNFAITKGFDGANFGVPILFARALLP